jgi:hypothetical protein
MERAREHLGVAVIPSSFAAIVPDLFALFLVVL